MVAAPGAPPNRVVTVHFGPDDSRRMVADRAHRGDIEGALGTVHVLRPESAHRWRGRTLLSVMGPGLLVMVANNDAGGVSLYAQAGQRSGLRAAVFVVALAAVLFVVQEMVARLGAVTGVGHARLILERFGARWGWFAVADLIVLNLLTIVTELIGVVVGAAYFGISRYVAVPCLAVVLVLATSRGRFRAWERVMYGTAAVSLVAVVLAVAALGHKPGARALELGPAQHAIQPSGLLFAVALVGTTVAPWQMFFQQSNVVDKRITSRFLGYERADTAIGTIVFTAVAVGLVIAAAAVLRPATGPGSLGSAAEVATGFEHALGAWAGAAYALVLLNGSVLGATLVTLSTSYAIGDVTGLRQSLHRPWRDARAFHGSFALLLGVASAIVLLPSSPLGLITVMVNVLAGVLLPSAAVFLVLLCNDRAVLGPWVNSRRQNLLATAVVAGMLGLSGLLVVTTLFPSLPLPALTVALIGIALAILLLMSITRRRSPPTVTRRVHPDPGPDLLPRSGWSMPRVEELTAPEHSRARTAGLVILRLYLSVSVALVVVRTIELLHT